MSSEQEIAAGVEFLRGLGISDGSEKTAGVMGTARTRIVAPSVMANVKKQLSTSGMRAPLKALTPPAPRIPKVQIPGIPGVTPVVKRAFIERLARGAARGADNVTQPLRTSLRDYAQGVHSGAFGSRHPVTGELVKEPNEILRRVGNVFRKNKVLSAKEKAVARGPDYYRGWARGQAADKGIGTSDMLTDFAKTYANPDGRVTASSLLDGAATSGILTGENIANVGSRLRGLDPRARGLTNGQMAAGAAGVGALGVGAGVLVSRRNKQE